MKTRNEELEAERLSKLPPDTAKEIKELQDKLVSFQCYLLLHKVFLVQYVRLIHPHKFMIYNDLPNA